MNITFGTFDIILTAFAVVVCGLSLYLGFIRRMSGAFSLIISGIGAYFAQKYIIESLKFTNHFYFIVIFLIIFVILFVLVKLVFRAISKSISKKTVVGTMDRVFGLVIGMVEVFVILLIISFIIVKLFPALAQKSVIIQYISNTIFQEVDSWNFLKSI